MKIFYAMLLAVWTLAQPAQGEITAEPLYDLEIYDDQIIFEVANGGCTNKERFHFEFELDGEKPVIYLVRTENYMCRGLFANVRLAFSMEEIFSHLDLDRQQPFSIGNPVYRLENSEP